MPGEGFSPLEVVHDGRFLRVRVAEFVDLPEAHLWQNRRPEGFLVTQLRDGLRAIGDSGLAHDLAAGRLTPPPTTIEPVNGFSPAQCEAYTSCLSPGVRLVWGPPGTGAVRGMDCRDVPRRLPGRGHRLCAAGGDVDTTAAIVGGIVAAYTGIGDRPGNRGVPPEWINRRELFGFIQLEA